MVPDGLIPCPLCYLHLDCQPMAFECPAVIQNVAIRGKYSDIFCSEVPGDVAITVADIQKFRVNFLENRQVMQT